MKEITAIDKSNKKEHFDIFIDNELFITCNVEIIKQLKLKVGKLVQQETLQEIIEENNAKNAFNKALHHLSHKRRTEAEVKGYLKDFDDSTIIKTIEKLRSYNFIDDEAYGEDFVVNQGSQLKGRYLIERKLTQKGIQQDIIESSLTMLSPDEELKNAEKLAYDYFKGKKSLPYNQIKQKLSQKLLGKGYNWEIIRKAISYLDENEEIQEMIQQQQEDYLSQALEAAEKLYIKYNKKAITKYQLKGKIQAALYQKGFEDDFIRNAIEKVMENK